MGKSKAKKGIKNKKKTLIVAVDIGKRKNVGYCRCPDGTEVKPFTFSNNGQGLALFWQRVCQAKGRYDLKEIVVGFESTGAYGVPLVHYLRKKPLRLVQVNPMHTKRLKELQGNSPNKTDKKDPKVIADIIELGHALTVVVPEGTAAELRRLTHARERWMKKRTEVMNQLQDLEFVIFPEFIQAMKGVQSQSARYLLQHYPRPEDIAAYGLAPLTKTLKKISRGQLGKERAEALYKGAKSSIGIREGVESILFEIKGALALLGEIERFVDKIEERLSCYLKEIPYSRFILSIKGIGEITAACLIGEVGDFSQFKTIAEMLKLAGLDLYEVSSGKHMGKRRISKRGRALLRKVLYFASLNVVRKGGILHEKYQEYLKRGMVKNKSLIAIARKLLTIIYALVRNGEEYKKDYEMPHRLKEAA